MRNRLPHLSDIPSCFNTPVRVFPIAEISLRVHDPIKHPVQTINQRVPYSPRSTRKRVSPRLHESEISFLDIVSLELDLELAGLRTRSCEEERAGRVLICLWSTCEG